MTQENRYFLDGADMWTNFGVGIESGSDDLLKMPKPKDRLTHDWTDENGVDVDLSRTFLEAKEVELRCHLIANNEADFWSKYNMFLTKLAQPGVRRLSVTELGHDFFVFYKDCTIYKRFTRIKSTNLVACKFTIKFVEKSPALNVQTFITDEDNLFLII